MIGKNKQFTAMLLTAAIVFLLTACGGPITPDTAGGSGGKVLTPETFTPADDSVRGVPLEQPKAGQTGLQVNERANLFVSGERSMMGFADWQYDTVYETAVSILADELNDFKTSYYRYDKYDIDMEAMAVADASALKADVRELKFYTADGLLQTDSIPSNVTRYKEDKLTALSAIDPWLSE